MKRYGYYLIIALVLLGACWWFYRRRVAHRQNPQISSIGLSVENLSPKDQSDLLKGVRDFSEVEFKPSSNLGLKVPASLRYLTDEGKFKFSVITQLPKNEAGEYFVWILPVDRDGWQLISQLQPQKGGMLTSASLPADVLPAKMVISLTDDRTKVMDQALFETQVPAP